MWEGQLFVPSIHYDFMVSVFKIICLVGVISLSLLNLLKNVSIVSTEGVNAEGNFLGNLQG